MRPIRSRRARHPLPALLALLGFAILATAPASAAQLRLDAGHGSVLEVDEQPFQLRLLESDGSESLATTAGLEGAPVRVPGVDGPSPSEPVGAAGGFPAIGFVYGSSPGVTFPASFFQGNRLFGAEAGALVSLVEVVGSIPAEDGGLTLSVRTDAPGLPEATVEIRPLPGGGVELDVSPPAGGVQPIASMFSLTSPSDEGLYGLGARKDAFNQRGRLRNVWTEQQNATSADGEVISGTDPTRTTGPEYTFPNGGQAAYFVQASLHGSRGWTAWIDQSELSRLDLAHSDPERIRWGVAAPELTLALAGGGIERSVRSYTADQGRSPAPPTYAYEPWIDVINEGEGEAAPNGMGFGGGKRVKQDLKEIVRMSRKHRIPIGTLGIEGWHVVPGKERFYERLREKGFRLSGYWNMFTSPNSEGYAEAKALDLFVKTETGEDYPIVTNRQGISYLIDFSHPAAAEYWRGQIDRSNELGIEAFMHDFGELITEGMVFHDGSTVAEMHNRYPVLYHRAGRAAVDAYAAENPGFEPFFYVRAGYSGFEGGEGVIADTPSVFPGDETTDWTAGSGIPSVPPAMLNLALGGSYAFTTDLGGYLDLLAPATSKELFIRWSQLAALTPISRIHNSTGAGSQYPWAYDGMTLKTYRRYARLKQRLIPLVDRWAQKASRSGRIGPVRPMVLEENSPETRSIRDQWMLGRRLLVAPIVTEGARSRKVYLPEGARWQRVTVNGKGRFKPQRTRRGGQIVKARAGLRNIPIFRKLAG